MLTELEKKNLYLIDSLSARLFLEADEIEAASRKVQGALQRFSTCITNLADEFCINNSLLLRLDMDDYHSSCLNKIFMEKIFTNDPYNNFSYDSQIYLVELLAVLMNLYINHSLFLQTQYTFSKVIVDLKRLNFSDY